MYTPRMADWGRWMSRLGTRARPSVAVAPRSVAACEHCGLALSLSLHTLPRCDGCGDGNPELALYSRHALQVVRGTGAPPAG